MASFWDLFLSLLLSSVLSSHWEMKPLVNIEKRNNFFWALPQTIHVSTLLYMKQAVNYGCKCSTTKLNPLQHAILVNEFLVKFSFHLAA